MAVPLGVLAAIYLNEYGGQRPTARVIRFMADVMTGVPSIVMGLFVAMIWVSAGLHARLLDVRRRAGARVPDAADRDPVERGDAEARARRAPPGERRARRPPVADGDARRAPGRARPASSAARCSRSRAPRARPHRCCSRSGSRVRSTRASARRTPRCRSRSGTTRSSRSPAAQDRAWGAALTLITIVFVLTVIARVVVGALRRRPSAEPRGAQLSGSSPRSHSRMRCSRSASRATRSRLRRNCGS